MLIFINNNEDTMADLVVECDPSFDSCTEPSQVIDEVGHLWYLLYGAVNSSMTIIGLWLYITYPMSTNLTYKHPYKEWLIESLLYMVPFGTTTLVWVLNLVTDHDNGPIDSAFVLIA